VRKTSRMIAKALVIAVPAIVALGITQANADDDGVGGHPAFSPAPYPVLVAVDGPGAHPVLVGSADAPVPYPSLVGDGNPGPIPPVGPDLSPSPFPM
jgi:hypothetical protein